MTIKKTNFPHIEQALEAAYPEKLEYARKAAWAEYRLLLKAAATPAPFWRPIEECPKESWEYYIILLYDGSVRVGQWDTYRGYFNCGDYEHREDFSYHEGDVTHFAEIPPLPESEAKS